MGMTRATTKSLVQRLVAVGAITALVWLAWSRRFTLDDAFISYRYALNLTEGRGLVFNPGERVEGYTNFLWTLLMAAGIRLGVPVILWSHLLGLACFVGSLAVVFLSARRLIGSAVWGLLAVSMVGINYSFSAYATGGLETSLQNFTVLLGLYLEAWFLIDPFFIDIFATIHVNIPGRRHAFMVDLDLALDIGSFQ